MTAKSSSEKESNIAYSLLLEEYRRDITRYLAKISKQARDDFTSALGRSLRVEKKKSEDTHLSDFAAYMKQLESIFEHPDPRIREQRIQHFKERVLYPFFLVKD